MKSFRKIIGAGLLLATGIVLAQPASDPPKPTSPGASEIFRQLPVLLEQVQNDNRKVAVLHLKARKEKDVIKLNCINDKLLQVRALMNIIDRQRLSMESSTERPDELNTLFGDLNGNVSGVRVLREQAEQCAGEGDLQSASNNEWTGPDLPDDPTKDEFPGDLEPPGYASPYN